MKNIYKIILGILIFSCLFSLNNFKTNNVHAFVYSKTQMHKHGNLFENAESSAASTSNKAYSYTLNHLLDEKAKRYIYNLYHQNASYLTKTYQFDKAIGMSYGSNIMHKDATKNFTNYYQYAKYGADLTIEKASKDQYKFSFKIKNRTVNDNFSYNKWEQGYINPKWLHYAYTPQKDDYTSIPFYTSLNQAIKFNPNSYSAKKELDFNVNPDHDLMLKTFSIKKKTNNVFMVKIDNKVYYVPKSIFSDSTRKFSVFEKYNTYVDKRNIWSLIDLNKQSNLDKMIFNQKASLNNQNIFKLYNGYTYHQYNNHIWQYNSSYYDNNVSSD